MTYTAQEVTAAADQLVRENDYSPEEAGDRIIVILDGERAYRAGLRATAESARERLTAGLTPDEYDDEVIDHLAAIRWYEAGAVIAWDKAAPEVQERYRDKARADAAPRSS